MNQAWYEVWADDGFEVPYLLVLQPNPADPNEFVIIDPKEDNQIVHRFETYDEDVLWLLEDEFTRVDGRMTI